MLLHANMHGLLYVHMLYLIAHVQMTLSFCAIGYPLLLHVHVAMYENSLPQSTKAMLSWRSRKLQSVNPTGYMDGISQSIILFWCERGINIYTNKSAWQNSYLIDICTSIGGCTSHICHPYWHQITDIPREAVVNIHNSKPIRHPYNKIDIMPIHACSSSI